MSMIQVKNLTFAYEGSYDNIFEDVSFQLDTKWKTGLIGRNGRGKTTFLRLLQGLYSYEGRITASVTFDYFPYPVKEKEKMTIDILQEVNPFYEHWELSRELNALKVSEEVLYRPFCTLSNGEQTKVLLAVLFLYQNHFLLIDEPTNHLDYDARVLVGQYLKKKNGFILVSHDRSFLDDCIDHVIAINRANIEVQQGNYTSWSQNKQMQDQFELAENEKLKKEIRQLSRSAKRTAQWSDEVEKSKFGEKVPDRGFIGHKAAKMMKRAKVTENRAKNAMEEKNKLLKNIEKEDSLKLSPLSYHKAAMMEAKDFVPYYGDKAVCEKIEFSLMEGERVALMGKNGCGKSTILKAILGEEISYKGELRMASGLSFSYVSQDTSFLRGNLKDYGRQHGVEESLFKAILRKLGFSREQFDKEMQDFSDGQKKKVLIAKSLCDSAHVYVWDEPLNFIDLLYRMQIEDLILKYQPTMIFVEHDKAFVDRIATKCRCVTGFC